MMKPFYIPCRQLELDARGFVYRTDGYHLSKNKNQKRKIKIKFDANKQNNFCDI